MAKMFYSLEEAAQKLGASEAQVKTLATEGKLQQFRDGNKLMFKRDQVEGLAPKDASANGASATAEGLALNGASDTGITIEESGGPIPLAEASDTGISVFDADEVRPVDPMAQTRVTEPASEEEELALESVASGSGLLDLTRESDDTSLGAELLEGIYPGNEGSDANVEQMTAAGTGAFESGMGMQAGSGTGMSMEGFEATAQAPAGALPAATSDPGDPTGNGLSIGLLLASTIALVITALVCVSAMFGVTSEITVAFTEDTSTFWMYVGILGGVSIVLGMIGFFVGKVVFR